MPCPMRFGPEPRITTRGRPLDGAVSSCSPQVEYRYVEPASTSPAQESTRRYTGRRPSSSRRRLIACSSVSHAAPIAWSLQPARLARKRSPAASTSRESAICSRNQGWRPSGRRSEEHTSELQSHSDLVCRLLLEKKK